MTTAPTHPKPRRRWFRFSLRTMLVCTALACLALGWWFSLVQRERRAVADIKKNGGVVIRIVDDDSKKNKFTTWIRKHATAWLGQNAHHVFGFDLFYNSWVFCNHRHTALNADPILLQCRELSSLTRITLHSTNASDLGVIHLAGHRNLEELDLSYCENITDASVPILAEIKSLRRLHMRGTKVTKASLPLLAKMKNLSHLKLPDIQLTEDERETLRKALPNANIYLGSQGILVRRAN